MPDCKRCGVPFTWGQHNDRWIPLVPVGKDEGLDRSYADSDGVLRAKHSLICVGWEPAVQLTKLAKVMPGSLFMGPPAPKKKRGRKAKE